LHSEARAELQKARYSGVLAVVKSIALRMALPTTDRPLIEMLAEPFED